METTFEHIKENFKDLKLNDKQILNAMKLAEVYKEVKFSDLEIFAELDNAYYLPDNRIKDDSAIFHRSLSSLLLSDPSSKLTIELFDSTEPENQTEDVQLDTIDGVFRFLDPFDNTLEFLSIKYRHYDWEKLTDCLLETKLLTPSGRKKSEKRGNVTITNDSYLDILAQRTKNQIASGSMLEEVTVTRESFGQHYGVDEFGNIV